MSSNPGDGDNTLYLVPVRDGLPLWSRNPRGVIVVRNRGHTIVGRLELLSCLYAACGCHQNVFSTKHKCVECQSVNEWALVALSTQMLRIRKGNLLSIRGGHAYAIISDGSVSTTSHGYSTVSCCNEEKHISKRSNEWRGEQQVSPNTTISIRELEGDGRLDFVVVEKCLPAAIEQQPFRPQQNVDEEFEATKLPAGVSSSSTATTKVGGGILDQRTKVKGGHQGIYVYFCSLGQDLSRHRQSMLSNEATLKGASVVSNYLDATHLVISKQVESLQALAAYLGGSEEDLANHFQTVSRGDYQREYAFKYIIYSECPNKNGRVQNNVQCVTPQWLSRLSSNFLLEKAHFADLWPGYLVKVRRHPYPCISHIEEKRQKLEVVPPNAKLSEAFVKLSKLYQGAPVLPEDTWKAYSFHKLAGRLLHLDDDLQANPTVLIPALKKIPGFSASTIYMLKEFIQCGNIKRIENLQRDPTRIAMGNMMSIWGVGRATALDLIQAGYQNIDQVRNGIEQGRLRFSRNQLAGVDCYEDLLEKMSRDEVESIGSIIFRAIESLGFSSAEATIMGSFRRGKSASGDVDVLITFKDHIHSVPGGALQQLVDLLWIQGHIAHHLTFLPGMSTGIHRTRVGSDDQLAGGTKLGPPLPESERKPQRAKSKGSSYMGVFHSPKVHGKRRRVDIKIYPRKQKPFACLYFTGSAQFNRSMRLFAKQRFGLHLTDRGLFDASGKSVMNGASTEKEIFERLNLVYKNPPSRGFFDDVVPLE